MKERGVSVDHSTLNRWVIKYAPEFESVASLASTSPIQWYNGLKGGDHWRMA